MEGGEGRDDPNTTWENDPTAGIVPRYVLLIECQFKRRELEYGYISPTVLHSLILVVNKIFDTVQLNPYCAL